MPYDTLKKWLIDESRSNDNIYLPYYNRSNKTFRQQSSHYFNQKLFNNDFVDLIPMIVANALTLRIVLCSLPCQQLRECLIAQPTLLRDTTGIPYVVVHLVSSYYSGTWPIHLFISLPICQATILSTVPSTFSVASCVISSAASTAQTIIPSTSTVASCILSSAASAAQTTILPFTSVTPCVIM